MVWGKQYKHWRKFNCKDERYIYLVPINTRYLINIGFNAKNMIDLYTDKNI